MLACVLILQFEQQAVARGESIRASTRSALDHSDRAIAKAKLQSTTQTNSAHILGFLAFLLNLMFLFFALHSISLSILSAVLYWLLDYEPNHKSEAQDLAAPSRAQNDNTTAAAPPNDAPDWVLEFTRSAAAKERQEAANAIATVKERIKRLNLLSNQNQNNNNNNKSKNPTVVGRARVNAIVNAVPKTTTNNTVNEDASDEEMRQLLSASQQTGSASTAQQRGKVNKHKRRVLNDSHSTTNDAIKDESSDSDAEFIIQDDDDTESNHDSSSSSNKPEWQRLLDADAQQQALHRSEAQTQQQRIESMLLSHHAEMQASAASQSASAFQSLPTELPIIRPQLIYTSRTHSQLSQIVEELQKTVHAQHVSLVALGARKHLCVHSGLRTQVGTGPSSAERLNDSCLEMQQSSSSKSKSQQQQQKRLKSLVDLSHSCPYLDSASQSLLRDHFITRQPEQYDLESAHRLGSRLDACSYYAARLSAKHAHIVTLPYQTLLHESTRRASGLDVRDAIVVIDECHHIVESMNDMHACRVTRRQLHECASQLERYVNKYMERMRESTKKHLASLQFAVQCCLNYLEQQQLQQQSNTKHTTAASSLQSIMTLNAFLCVTQLHTLNLHSLHAFIQRTELAKKLNGFVTKYDHKAVANASQTNNTSSGSVQIHNNTKPGTKTQTPRSNLNVLLGVDAFLQSLMHSNADGRVMLDMQPVQQQPQQPHQVTSNSATSSSKHSAILRAQRDLKSTNASSQTHATSTAAAVEVHPQSSLQFLLLNPSHAFASLVREARAVLLVGGTIQPFSHITRQLQLDKPAVVVETTTTHATQLESNHGASVVVAAQWRAPTLFACDHVIDPSHVICVSLHSGPAGVPFELNFSNRADATLHCDIGRSLLNLCHVCPQRGGIVVFFTSYAMEQTIVASWRASGLLDQLHKRKPVFRELSSEQRNKQANDSAEAESGSASIDSVLADYSACVRSSGRGALLTCVMGGKLSEGINFSDDLARLVVVVGMPYANPNDALLKEKMRFLDKRYSNATVTSTQQSKSGCAATPSPGASYYENLCMRSVNQSIGRSIRHKNDYAAIVLMDTRYAKAQVAQQLPAWIQRRLFHAQQFGQAFGHLRTFFKQRAEAQTAATATATPVTAAAATQAKHQKL